MQNVHGTLYIPTLLLILICITPLIITPFSFAFDFFYLPKIVFIYAILALIISIWILYEKEKFIKPINTDNTTKLVCIYFCFILLSTILSPYFHMALWGNVLREEGFFALTSYILLFLFASKYLELTEKYLSLFVLSSSIVAIYGILQHFNLDFIQRDVLRNTWSSVAFSTIGNPNFLATFLVLSLPLTMYKYFSSTKYIYLFSCGTLYLCLLMTMTRGAWIGVFLSYIFILVILVKKKLYFDALIKLTLLFVLMSVCYNLLDNGHILNRLLTIQSDLMSLILKTPNYENVGSFRVIIWEHTIELIKSKPFFGYGPDTISKAISDYYKSDYSNLIQSKLYFDKAHNEYLQIAFASGLPALLFYFLFIVSIILQSLKKLNNNIIIIFVLASIIGYIVQAFFNISVVSVAYIFWILLGSLSFMIKK